jgi:hypothetical protein
MKDNSLYRLGGLASIVFRITYLVNGIANALVPAAVTVAPNGQYSIMYFDQDKFLILTNWCTLLIGAIFALAMIPAVRN